MICCRVYCIAVFDSLRYKLLSNSGFIGRQNVFAVFSISLFQIRFWLSACFALRSRSNNIFWWLLNGKYGIHEKRILLWALPTPIWLHIKFWEYSRPRPMIVCAEHNYWVQWANCDTHDTLEVMTFLLFFSLSLSSRQPKIDCDYKILIVNWIFWKYCEA